MLEKHVAHNSLLPLYLAWQLTPNSANYHVNFSYRLQNRKSVELLIDKLQVLVSLKAYLRQTFSLENEVFMVSFHQTLPPEIAFHICKESDFTDLEQRLIKNPHDLNGKSAVQLHVVSFNNHPDYIVLFNIHHILMDGSTLDRFITDLNHLLANQTIQEETISDYQTQLNQEAPLRVEEPSRSVVAYQSQIKEIAEQMDSSGKDERNVLHYASSLPIEVTEKLVFLSQQQEISRFNLLLLAYGVFLSKLFDKKSVLVNYPVNIRENKNISGSFLNVVTLPLSISNEDTFLSLIDWLCVMIPTLKIIAKVKSENEINFLKIPNFSSLTAAQLENLIIFETSYAAKSYPQIAQANISFKYREQGGKLFFICDLLENLFPTHFSSSLLNRFFNYLYRLLDNLRAKLASTDIVFEEERIKILFQFNNVDPCYRKNKTLNQLFEEQVERTPHHIALVFQDKKLTYLELNKKSNQLAHYIRNRYEEEYRDTLKPNTCIVILLERSLDMIVSILGILKAGAAYVPIDPNCPKNRIDYILQDTQASFGVSQENIISEIGQDAFLLNWLILNEITYNEYPNINLTLLNTSKDLAYIIYTSGTTGSPKGVMIEHHSLSHLAIMQKKYFNYNEKMRSLQFFSLSFDASILEIFPSLISGGCLYVISEDVKRDVDKLTHYINNNKIEQAALPAALLPLVPDYLKINALIIGGDKCNQKAIEKWVNRTRLINSYGPTEYTVCATMHEYHEGDLATNIGKAIANTNLYILDSNLNLLPTGVVGELYIDGEGLARGYLNCPDLTKERFVQNPFEIELGQENVYRRLYRTGDLVRWLPNGNLEYIRRRDFQVKIMGYRIELGEIERVLSKYPGISQSAVVLKEKESNKYLVGYYISKKKLQEDDIFKFLKEYLPDYMLPSLLVYMEEFPLTLSGKLDLKAFPDPGLENNDYYSLPISAKEELICYTMAEVLGLRKVGVDDDFFKIGGSSIKAIALSSRLQAYFRLGVSDVFNLKTPKNISDAVFLEKNNLIRRLLKIKSEYENKKDYYIVDKSMEKEKTYFDSRNDNMSVGDPRAFTSILLTGATGFLGCNLLNQLLLLTNHTVFLLIRGESEQEVRHRLNKKFQFYFSESLEKAWDTRIFAIKGDIEKENLGLSVNVYQNLSKKIDAIIHAAALVKHYGHYDQFYSANVQSTIHLLEFSRLTRLKDFYYISTRSVLDTGYIPNGGKYIYTEEDTVDEIQGRSNYYVRTKYEAERAVIDYQQYGIRSYIYRVGNLAIMASNGQSQENSEENAFFSRLKCLLKLGVISPSIHTQEISAADDTAKAIIKLFNKPSLEPGNYHVFNPNLCNLAQIFSESKNLSLKVLSVSELIDVLIEGLDHPEYGPLVECLLLHQGWLEEKETYFSPIQILQNKTEAILAKLEFHWSTITSEMLSPLIERACL